MSMRAIETVYNGYRFRSRLEARWAVFFDTCGIPWEYETEGFESGGTRYLPDFYLPDQKVFVEVKGVLNDKDYKKIEQFVISLYETEYRGLYLVGKIPNPEDRLNWDSNYSEFWTPDKDNDTGEIFAYSDEPYRFCVCPICGKVGIEFDGRGYRVDNCVVDHIVRETRTIETRKGTITYNNTYVSKEDVNKWYYPEGYMTHEDKGYTYNHPRFVNAYNAARKSRFEYGEEGYN